MAEKARIEASDLISPEEKDRARRLAALTGAQRQLLGKRVERGEDLDQVLAEYEEANR